MGAIAFALALGLQSQLQFGKLVLTSLMNITIELLGLGAVFLTALEIIQGIYIQLVEKHNELAEIARSLLKIPITESPQQATSAAEKLIPIKTFIGKVRDRYLLVRRMFFYGFLVILLVDLVLQLGHYLVFAEISSYSLCAYPVASILFAVEIALLGVSLVVLLFALRVAVGYSEPPQI